MSSAARALVIAAALGLAAPGTAAAATRAAEVCQARVAVLDGPNGFAIAYLYRDNPVRIVRTSPSGRWARISARGDLRGWVPRRSLCRS